MLYKGRLIFSPNQKPTEPARLQALSVFCLAPGAVIPRSEATWESVLSSPQFFLAG